MTKPKILLFDIETAPIVAYVWGLWDNNVSLNQIKKDTHLLSWSAKWLEDPDSKVMYMDQRDCKNIEDDKNLVKSLKALLDKADIVITHNGLNFDIKVVNARLLINGLKPLMPHIHIDTYSIAKNKFRMTSNKLEYIAKILKVNHQKLVKRKFGGQELWNECLKGNMKAWQEMEKYNKQDTLVLQEVYKKLRPWNKAVNMGILADLDQCECGSTHFHKHGYVITRSTKKQRYVCRECGKTHVGGKNLALDTMKNIMRSV